MLILDTRISIRLSRLSHLDDGGRDYSTQIALIMHGHLLLLIPVVYLVYQVVLRLGRAIFSPLRAIPGPFWSRFTALWYFNRVRNGQFGHDNIKLHKQYGPIVRIAPNQYSFSDISAVKTIYGTGSQFAKSAWYDGWRHPEQWTVFTDRDIKRHGMRGY